jgi:UDP-glucuronate 4-epimerase
MAGKGISEVIHLAAKAGVRPSVEKPEDYLRANLAGTLRLLEFSRKRGIERFIFGSSSSVYGDESSVPFREDAAAMRPLSPYAASKRGGELYCWNYSCLHRITVAALRFFAVYGPRQRPDLAIHKFSKRIAAGKPIVLYGDGGMERDYTFVTDITEGVQGALAWTRRQPPGSFGTFNLGGSRPISLLALVKHLEGALGKRARIEWAPKHPSDVLKTCADITLAGRELGYRPRIPIELGIQLFADWFVEQSAVPQALRDPNPSVLAYADR